MVAANLIWLTASLSAQESRLVRFEQLPLPPKVDGQSTVVDWRHTHDGWLFVAYEHAVYVKSPWGWDKIWQLTENDNSIRALGSVHLEDSERLLVGTESGIWEVHWERRTPLKNRPWMLFSYDFKSRKLSGARYPMASRIVYPTGTDTVKAYALASGGRSRPVIVENAQLVLGAPLFQGQVFQVLQQNLWARLCCGKSASV